MDMRVTNAYTAYNVTPARTVVHAKRADTARQVADRVSFSNQAEDYKTARKAVAATPDIRVDLVNSIKAMIDAGTYSVSAGDVASRILGIS